MGMIPRSLAWFTDFALNQRENIKNSFDGGMKAVDELNLISDI